MVAVFFFLGIKRLFCINCRWNVLKMHWQWQPVSHEGFQDLKSFSADPIGNDIDKKLLENRNLTYFWFMMASSHNQ